MTLSHYNDDVSLVFFQGLTAWIIWINSAFFLAGFILTILLDKCETKSCFEEINFFFIAITNLIFSLLPLWIASRWEEERSSFCVLDNNGISFDVANQWMSESDLLQHCIKVCFDHFINEGTEKFLWSTLLLKVLNQIWLILWSIPSDNLNLIGWTVLNFPHVLVFRIKSKYCIVHFLFAKDHRRLFWCLIK